MRIVLSTILLLLTGHLMFFTVRASSQAFEAILRQCSPTVHSEKLYRVRYKINYHRCASDGDALS